MLNKPFVFWFLLGSLFMLFLLTINTVHSTTLWGDESLRAMIAKNTVKRGYPTHWDGARYVVGVEEKLFSQLFPEKYVEISSWSQYYLIGLSYRLFGETTFTTRLPFWIAGFLVFIVLYYYRRLLPKSNTTFALVIILLLFNVTFLIYVQQANYYIYAVLLTLLSSFIFMDLLTREGPLRKRSLLFLVVVNFALAHTHIPTAVTMFIVQAVFLFFKTLKKGVVNIAFVLGHNVVSGVLLFLAIRLYSSTNVLQPGKLFWSSLVVFLTQINFYIFPFVGFIVLLFLLFKYRLKLQGKLWLLYISSLTIAHLLLLSFFNYAGVMPFRYVSSYMALWFIALAIIMVFVPRQWMFVVLFFALVIHFYSGISKFFTSVILPQSLVNQVRKDMPTIPLISRSRVRCFYCEYYNQLTNPYPHPLQSVIDELKAMNVVDKKLIAGPCEGNTIMFYTKAVIVDQMPKKLYKERYKKEFESNDVDIIVNNTFCSSKMDHDALVSQGYKYKGVTLPQIAFINDGELNIRSPIGYPFEPFAVIYYKR